MPTHPNVLKAAVDDDFEVSAVWASAHRGDIRLVDIREPHELSGPLGRLEGVENIPLLQLLGQAPTLDADQPLVMICRSGRRSAGAARALVRQGFDACASVEGGMLAWNLEVLGKQAILQSEQAANVHNLSEAVYRTNGLPEVSAQWVAANIGRFRLVDVRNAPELESTGRVAQSEHVPLPTFMEQAQELDRDLPLVVMCASGGRSGRVIRALESAGFGAVASMEGGMFGWKAYGLPIG